MKIRIKGNSIRYRLTRPEVERFGETGYIEEKINFGGNTLIYSLQEYKTDDQLTASFHGNKISVFMPESWKERWVDSEKVGFEGYQHNLNSESLHILIEKDFQCLDNVAEDQSDQYPNPLAENK
ncbi:hypothetical protein BH23BAC1_BH23BAC1_37650 [soil metagenome]